MGIVKILSKESTPRKTIISGTQNYTRFIRKKAREGKACYPNEQCNFCTNVPYIKLDTKQSVSYYHPVKKQDIQ